jgi:hypothetical protein
MTGSARRENIPVTDQEVSVLDRLMQPDSAERRALSELVGELGSSRASLAHAVLSIGLETLKERVLEDGYAALAASYTDQEHSENRAETRSRRARLAALHGDE